MPPIRPHLDRLAITMMVGLCSIWGLQQAAIKVASVGVSPMWQAGLRSAGAALLIWAWARTRGLRLGEPDRTLLPGSSPDCSLPPSSR